MKTSKISPSKKQPPNLGFYEEFRFQFSWEEELQKLSRNYAEQGLNIAYHAIDKHCEGPSGEYAALRWVQEDGSTQDYSYNYLKLATSKFANILLSLGVKQGETVFTFLGRTPELYISALGALKYKAVFCPLFSVFGPEPAYERLKSGAAKVLVTTKNLYETKIEQLVSKLPDLEFILIIDIEEHLNKKILSFPQLMEEASDQFEITYTDPETPALLHFTSGTTGMPKGALHVQQAVLMHYVTGKYVLDFHPEDIFWCTADPGWVTGTSYGIIAPLLHGITNIVDAAEFDVERWFSILQNEKVTVWYTAPTAIRRLMRIDYRPRDRYQLGNLRLILSVGEPLNPEAVVWGEEAFGMKILDNWWQTETGGIMIANYRSMEVKPGSMGKPLPGIEAAIADVENGSLEIIDEPNMQGHLVLKKGWPSMFRSYLNQEKRYKKCFVGDWYVSGDLAKMDEDGYFWFVGRADDIIKTSGHMVGPFEVESTLMEHPDVLEAAVIGIPNPIIGQMVKAYVVLGPNAKSSAETRQHIMGHARSRLGPAIAPKEIEFVDSLPKTKSGKILRRLLKAKELGLPEGDTSTLEN